MAPEIYDYRFHINSDIWSLGVCIYGLLTNDQKEQLFKDRDTSEKEYYERS